MADEFLVLGWRMSRVLSSDDLLTRMVFLWKSRSPRVRAGSSPARNYRIEERKAGLLTRTFTGVVNGTQRASAKPTDVDKVERWCKLKASELPKDGGSIRMNLDDVQRD